MDADSRDRKWGTGINKAVPHLAKAPIDARSSGSYKGTNVGTAARGTAISTDAQYLDSSRETSLPEVDHCSHTRSVHVLGVDI